MKIDNKNVLQEEMRESLDSRLSIREQYEKMRQQTDVSVTTITNNVPVVNRKPVEKTMSNSPKAESNLSTAFKKRRKDERYV